MPRPFRLRLSHQAQERLTLLVVAMVPLAIFATVAVTRIQAAVDQDADNRLMQHLGSVEAVMDRARGDLQGSAASYATWSVLQQQVANLQLSGLQSEVIDFVVQSGVADAALLRVGQQRLEAGAEGTALAAALDARLAAGGAAAPGTTEADLGDGLFLVAIERVELAGLAGPGVTAAAPAGAWLAFAKRLDSTFVLEAKRLTGFDVAFYGPGGSDVVTTDASAASRLTPLPSTPPAGTEPSLRRAGSTLAALVPLRDDGGHLLGWLAVFTDLGVLGAIEAAVVPLLVAVFILAAVLAFALAILLTELLRRRLGVIEEGIAAVTAGDLSVRLPTEGTDPLGRLAASHNRLAAALDHRDRIVRESWQALGGLGPALGEAETRRQGLAAAEAIFDLDACQLVDEAPPDPSMAFRCRIGDHDAWLVASPHQARTWSEAERAAFELFAHGLGVALHDARTFEAARRRAARLDRLNRLQADFLRGVSHNLQTPLTRIITTTDDIRSSADTTPFVRERVEVAWTEARRLSRLVGQLLTLSRLDAGAFQPDEAPCALAPLVRRAWQTQPQDRRLELMDTSQGSLAIADRAAVEQILWVLLDNACRYAATGPIRVHISVGDRAPRPTHGERPGSQELLVRVEDEGPGVPAAERERIFRRFERGSSSRGQEGTGLGLGVARSLAEAMGGRLTYEARPVGGACFVLSLPAEPAQEA